MKKVEINIIIFLLVQFIFTQDSSFMPAATKVTEDRKEYICSILKSYKMYKAYDIQTLDNEIILKSKELRKNKYNQNSYEIINVNNTTSQLIWIDKEKNVISANDMHLCIIHKCKMGKHNIPILYGLIKFLDLDYVENIRENHFPNCNDIILGGCVVKEKRYEEKYICKECIKARDEWILKNRYSDYVFYNYKE